MADVKVLKLVKQPHEVTRANGKPINWKRPPKPNTMCSWTKRTASGQAIRGSFRTLCHLNRLNNLALRQFGSELVVIQPPWNTGVAASAGTHDLDAVWDLFIPGVDWWVQQRFFRANGFACWYRHPPLFTKHIHGFTLPPREGKSVKDDFAVHGFRVGAFVPGQLEDYYRHSFGLANQHNRGSDQSWFPKRIEATIFDLDRYVAQRAA